MNVEKKWRRTTNNNHMINFISQILDQMINPIALLDQINLMPFTGEKYCHGIPYHKMDWKNKFKKWTGLCHMP
jgi:hypothetical protein